MNQIILFFRYHLKDTYRIVGVLLILACTSALTAFAQSSEALEQRVRTYWDAKVSGDAVLAYEYEAVKAKGTVPLSKYVRGTGNLIYEEVAVLNVETIAAGQATVLLQMKILVPGMLEPITTKTKDTWIEIGGEWYHSPPKSRLGS